MAVGKARPHKGEENLMSQIVTPAFGTSEDIERREVLEPEAKSKDEIDAEGEETPTGEEIHAKARELDAVPAAKPRKGKKATGKEVVKAATEDKAANVEKEDLQAEEVARREAEVLEAKEAEEEAEKIVGEK